MSSQFLRRLSFSKLQKRLYEGGLGLATCLLQKKALNGSYAKKNCKLLQVLMTP